MERDKWYHTHMADGANRHLAGSELAAAKDQAGLGREESSPKLPLMLIQDGVLLFPVFVGGFM